ncbi:MAG: hypothetical protein GY934_10235, partial [Gammaproteobacteria bacterium]|nr:hypothetical protein [Gammaproteobacteria bacterium]
DADFSAYCRENFSNSSYQRLSQSWGTQHVCSQGGTLQGIDLAEACRITTGSRDFEVSGTRVLCSGSSKGALAENANDLGSPDLIRYCNDHFPNSSYERRFEPGGAAHYCRRPGVTTGYTLQPIDLLQACQKSFNTQEFRKIGVQVICTKPRAKPVTRLPVTNSGNTGVKPGARPFPPPTKRDPPALPANLPFEIPTPEQAPAGTPAENNTPFMAPSSVQNNKTMSACRVLGGKWRSGTLPLVQSYLKARDGEIAERLPGCNNAVDPQCKSRVMIETGIAAYFKTIMVWQCHIFMLNSSDGYTAEEIQAARKESCEIGKSLTMLSKATDAHGSQISNLPVTMMLDTSMLDDFCSGPKLRLMRRIADGLREVEDNIVFYGGPFYVEAIYEDAPQDSEKTVKVNITGGNTGGSANKNLEVKLQRTEEANVLRSEDFYIFAEDTNSAPNDSGEVRP